MGFLSTTENGFTPWLHCLGLVNNSFGKGFPSGSAIQTIHSLFSLWMINDSHDLDLNDDKDSINVLPIMSLVVIRSD